MEALNISVASAAVLSSAVKSGTVHPGEQGLPYRGMRAMDLRVVRLRLPGHVSQDLAHAVQIEFCAVKQKSRKDDDD